MRLAGHELAVPAYLGGLLVGCHVSPFVRHGGLGAESRRSAHVPEVQRFRLGHASAGTGGRGFLTNSRHRRYLEGSRPFAL